MQESSLQGDPTDLSRGAAIRGISDATECAAKQIEYTTRRSRSREADIKPEDLREAEQLAKSLPPEPERRAARNKERKLRRRWKTKQVAPYGRWTVRNVPSRIMFDGRLTADRTKWVKGVRDHCWEKYYDTRCTAEQQWRTVSMLRACMKAVILDGWKAPVLTFDVVLRARTLFQSNKVGGGKDEIVYEMIQGLPLCVVSVLWRLFDARYKGEVYEDMESWRWLLLIFLPKERHPTTLKDFRGICLMSALSKWYMSAVVLLAKAQPTPLSWKNLGVFAYREGLSCIDALLPIQLVMEAGSERKRENMVCLASGDVLTAFDSLTVD